MNLPVAVDAAQSVHPPKGMDAGRFENRSKLFKKLLDQHPQRDSMSDFQRESMLRSLENAHRLLSSKERDAFDISLDTKEAREAYGDGQFGQGCLLARRLVENGARYIEVTTEYIPFVHWDTHADGHATVDRLHREIDRPLAQLVKDLESRGLLDRTLIVLASEFSRDAMIEGVPNSTATDQATVKGDKLESPQHYGLHRHFTGGTSVVMFGGGMKRGHLYGQTADERPLIATKNPVSISDLHATMFTAMGISPKTAIDIEGRPFYVTLDGKGQAVRDLFA